jgi:hypothetical protein
MFLLTLVFVRQILGAELSLFGGQEVGEVSEHEVHAPDVDTVVCAHTLGDRRRHGRGLCDEQVEEIGSMATRNRRSMFSLAIMLVWTGITDVIEVQRFHTLIRIRKLNPNAATASSTWPLVRLDPAGALETSSMAPIESARPKIRSDRLSMGAEGSRDELRSRRPSQDGIQPCVCY